MSNDTVALQNASSACSVCKVTVKAEASYWGIFVTALMWDLSSLFLMSVILMNFYLDNWPEMRQLKWCLKVNTLTNYFWGRDQKVL